MSPPAAALAPGRGELAARWGVVGYVVLLVGIPLTAILVEGLKPGLGALWRAVSAPAVTDALVLTLWTAALMAVVNAVMGTAMAWVLVRYRFPGRSLLSALVDLPFAIPTLVAGVMLVLLFGPQEPVGGWLTARGFPIAFASPGIVLALLFITLPLVTRAVEPVLMELDPAEEEAALTLGASTWVTFRRVLLPPLLPAVAYGSLQSFSRAIAEFGSVVVISGNIPHRTLTAPVLIFGEVESGRPEVAAGVSIVLIVIALGFSLFTRTLYRLRAPRGS